MVPMMHMIKNNKKKCQLGKKGATGIIKKNNDKFKL